MLSQVCGIRSKINLQNLTLHALSLACIHIGAVKASKERININHPQKPMLSLLAKATEAKITVDKANKAMALYQRCLARMNTTVDTARARKLMPIKGAFT